MSQNADVSGDYEFCPSGASLLATISGMRPVTL